MNDELLAAYSIVDRPEAELRVLQLASGDLWAGAEVQLYYLACYLQRQEGVALLVVLLNPGELEQRLIAAGVAMEVIDEGQAGFVRLLNRLSRICRGFKPDVIHTHRQKENLLGSLAALIRPGTYSMRTVHGGNEHLPRFLQVDKRLRVWVDHWLGQHLQKPVVCVSDDLKTVVSAHYSADRLLVIENGVDVAKVEDLARSGNVELKLDRFLVAFVGRMVPIKRIDLFVEIARLADRDFPGKFYFYAIGDGPELAGAQQQAISHGIESISFTGFRADAQSWLARMNALCITSDHEGLPMGLLEAMALRVPVVTRAVGGITQVLGGGDAGAVVKSADPHLFVEALNQLRVDSEYSQSVVEAGWERVNDCFSAAAMAEKYQRVYARFQTTRS